MKKLINEKILFSLILALMIVWVVNAEYKQKKYYVFNTKTGKLYPYTQVLPKNSVTWTASADDTLTIISRAVVKDKSIEQYFYKVKSDHQNRTIYKIIDLSSVSRGVNGDLVTSWNSYKFPVSTNEKVSVTNNCESELLIKFNSNINKSSRSHKTKSDYIAYPPDFYDNSIDLLVNDKIYTYYQGKTNGIEMQLQGPALLKVINRQIAEEINMLSFSWIAKLDGREILYVSDSVPYSNSCLADSSSIVTQGKVNILEIPEGVHEIRIEDEEPRGIIYRFYLSKSSLGK